MFKKQNKLFLWAGTFVVLFNVRLRDEEMKLGQFSPLLFTFKHSWLCPGYVLTGNEIILDRDCPLLLSCTRSAGTRRGVVCLLQANGWATPSHRKPLFPLDPSRSWSTSPGRTCCWPLETHQKKTEHPQSFNNLGSEPRYPEFLPKYQTRICVIQAQLKQILMFKSHLWETTVLVDLSMRLWKTPCRLTSHWILLGERKSVFYWS